MADRKRLSALHGVRRTRERQGNGGLPRALPESRGKARGVLGRAGRNRSCTGSRSGRTCSSGIRRSPSGSSGGKTNVSYNCLDRHLTTPRKNKVAILWEGEPGDQRMISYQELHRLVCRFANVLKARGLKAGDRAIIYMGMVPELPVALLACARLGITH